METPHNTTQAETGWVLSYQANVYTVLLGQQRLTCMLKGLLKKQGLDVRVGDRVRVDAVDPTQATGRIVEVLSRQTVLERPKIANVALAVVVASCREPDLDVQALDRTLTHAVLAGLLPLVCISKCDLAENMDEMNRIQALYQDQLGYPVYRTSIHDPASIQQLRGAIEGKVSVLAGASGVGKSSLLNVLRPDLNLRVAEVSEKIQRGQHTTRHATLIELAPETYMADTPGFSQLTFETVAPEALEAVMPDFSELRAQCEFRNCLHLEETGCAVLLQSESIADSRWQSYRAMMAEALAGREIFQKTSQKDDPGYKLQHQKGEGSRKMPKLSGKDREASRRTRRQSLDTLLVDEDDAPLL